MKVLEQNGYTFQIPLGEAKELFQKTMNIMDRISLKAYFGTQRSRSLRKIEQRSTYASGTISFKHIELAQNITQRKGYFEILGLATFERKGQTWFMILTNELLVPELSSQHEESFESSIENLSLSPILQGKECEKTVLEVVSPNNMETKENKQTTTYRVRDINMPQNRFLTLDGERHTEYASKHKKCLECGKTDPSNPYRVWCPQGMGERTRQDTCILEGEKLNG